MSANYKSFIPFRSNYTRNQLLRQLSPSALEDKIERFFTADPSETSWSSAGLVADLFDGGPVVNLDGTAVIMAVQFNDRILPAKVRDEKLLVRVNDLAEREGRRITKKEYAELRDDVVRELLPQAFIKRTVVPVVFYDNRILVFTSSQKRAMEAIQVIHHATHSSVGLDLQVTPLGAVMRKPATDVLTLAVQEGTIDALGEDQTDEFVTGKTVTLKGEEKKTVRVKDVELPHVQVDALVQRDDYRVVELGLQQINGEGHLIMSFSVNEQFAVKGCKLSDFALQDHEGKDAYANAWLVAKMFSALTALLEEAFGGEVKNEDDEL